MVFAQGVQELAGKVVGDVMAYKPDAAASETKARLLKKHPDCVSLPEEELNTIFKTIRDIKWWQTSGSQAVPKPTLLTKGCI